MFFRVQVLQVQVFQGPSPDFRVQIPGSGSRVQVQGPGPGFRSSYFLPKFNFNIMSIRNLCANLIKNLNLF